MMGSDNCPPALGHGSDAFEERFETLEEVRRAIRDEGIEHCSLMFGKGPFFRKLKERIVQISHQSMADFCRILKYLNVRTIFGK